VFLHPSETSPNQDQEGVPNSLLEAMATGLPVAATQHGGIPEAVEHGRSGNIAGNPNNVVSVPQTLIETRTSQDPTNPLPFCP